MRRRPGRAEARPRRRVVGAVLLVLSLLSSIPSPAMSDPLERRLEGLAAQAVEAVAFEEERRSSLLGRPIVVRGWLVVDRPADRLTKRVEAPRPARLTLTPSHLEAESGGRTRRLPLDRRPELAALLTGLRALLDGDAEALRSRFQADYLEGRDDAWLLRLVPHDETLAQRLVLLEVRGEGDRVETIDTVTADGERQRMTLLQDEADDAP